MNEITRHQPAMQMVLRPQNFNELMQFAITAAKSSMVPTAFRGKPEDIVLAVQMGSEVGLAPMQALQNIAVINGRPSLWGDAVLALVKAHPDFVSCSETIDGDGDLRAARCEIVRRGQPPVVSVFSVRDAKTAGLWGKSGPWQAYPDRMLKMRARGFAARDSFPDALRGMITREEAADLPVDQFAGQTIDAKVEAVREEEPMTLDTKGITPRQFLAVLSPMLNGALTKDDVDAIIALPRVQRAMDVFQNGAKAALDEMIAEAISRTAPPVDDDGWPGADAGDAP